VVDGATPYVILQLTEAEYYACREGLRSLLLFTNKVTSNELALTTLVTLVDAERNQVDQPRMAALAAGKGNQTCTQQD
jgi:hypothetical protein